MRRYESGIGCGARGRGMNAPPKLPGGAGAPPGDTRIPCQELADGGPSGLPEVLRQGRPKGASVEGAARQSRNGTSESAARRRNDAAMARREAPRAGNGT